MYRDKVFDQMNLFPGTRYMGSKEKLIKNLYEVFENIEFESSLDLMSGTGIVSYLLKSMGKKVDSNDYMNMNYNFSKALIENHTQGLNKNDIELLLKPNNNRDFVQKKFKGLYFSEKDNQFIDSLTSNIDEIKNPFKKSLAKSALIRSCVKKRPRGIFAYTGMRYLDGRKDLKMNLEEHFILNTALFNKAVFDSKKECKSFNCDFTKMKRNYDLVYIDPPYFSPLSDNEYVRRYHFVEGLSLNWKGVEIQEETKTKKIKNYPSPFSKLESTIKAFEDLIYKYKNSSIVISYSSNSLPKKEFFVHELKKYKKNVNVIEIDYRYSFSNKKKNSKNVVLEYIIIGTNK
jgi:DNA adenine methylase